MLSFSGTYIEYALWITAKKPGVSGYGSWSVKTQSHATETAILAFYCSDPFPLFLVRDHFSCKYVRCLE